MNYLSLESVDQKTLSRNDLLKLIKACKENGVQELKFQGLHLTFGATEIVAQESPPLATEIVEDRANEQEALTVKSALADKISEKEDEVANLMITDPAEYERLILEGELSDAGQSPQH